MRAAPRPRAASRRPWPRSVRDVGGQGGFGVAIGLAILAVALASVGMTLALAGEAATKDPGSLAMNLVIVAAFPIVAAIIARTRPSHHIARLFVIVGLGAAATIFTYGYARYGLEVAPSGLPGAAYVGWASTWVWVGGVMPLVTLGVLLFPDGRLPSRRWWPVAAAAISGMVLMTLSFALRPGPLVDHPVVDNPFGVGDAGPLLEQVESLGFLLFSLSFVGSCLALVVRWRRGTPSLRRQLRWLLFAVAILAASFVVDATVGSTATSVVVAAALAFLPVAVGIAIVREHLYDIDLLINRAIVYTVLTAGVVASYVVVVTAIGAVLDDHADFVGPLVATGMVAVAFQPVRSTVQRQVSRIVYGAAADPYAALARLARRLESTIEPTAVLPVVVETVATTLRLPYAAIELIEDDRLRPVASYGEAVSETTELLLSHQGATIGRMVLGQRASGERLTATERRLLEDLVRQAGIAVHGVRLTAALQRSRERLVVAREEERRRLHRDLHDGLGPTLASITLQLDVLRRRIDDDPPAAQILAQQLKDEVQAAIPEIRRLVDALRPPALDELGLVAALQQRALAMDTPNSLATALTVIAEGDIPRLAAATEVAAYRIVMEAVTNVVRHADARHCSVRICSNEDLVVEIADDGCGLPEDPRPGVGLGSMHERAAELGGEVVITRRAEGGTLVRVRLPLETR